MQPNHVLIVQAPSGRWAILIRVDDDQPWVQIESCSTEAAAWAHVDDAGLADDDALRAYEIAATAEDDGAQPDWGADAPTDV